MRMLAVLAMAWGIWAAPVARVEAGQTPWKEGEVITAELVGVQGEHPCLESIFATPDGAWIDILLYPREDCAAYRRCDVITRPEALEHVGPGAEDHILAEAYLGRRMRITFQRLARTWTRINGDTCYLIIASDVRLDRNPFAPRHTRIIPRRTLRGTIFCPKVEDAYGYYYKGVYMIAEDGKKYTLVRKSTWDGTDFSRLCGIKGTAIVRGDILRENAGTLLFHTESASPEL